MEFKRAANDDAKEESKWELIRRALDTPATRDLELVSRRVHWYAKSDTRKGLQTWIVPYLDFPTLESDEEKGRMELASYVQEAAQEACSLHRLSESEITSCRRYLDLVAKVQRPVSAASGALFLQVVGDQVQYVALPNLSDIFLSAKEILEQAERIEMAMRKQYELPIRREIKHSHEIDGRGLSIG